MPETIHTTVDDRGIARLTLARGEKHNAMSARMIDELTAAAQEIGANAAIRVVILAGEGASFCAGGDLGWMRAQFDADRIGRIAEARRFAMMLKTLSELPQPLIARVHGNAFGGGIGLISICDLAIAAATARFGLTEVRLGLIPATISPYVVARIGEGKARPLFLTGKIIDAWQAHAAGLVVRVVPAAELDEAVENEVRHFLDTAPGAVVRAKALSRSLGMPISEDIIDNVVERLADIWETAEAREGISAFFERRQPAWIQRD
jgi:methylglutaconyl-CoA hydratase